MGIRASRRVRATTRLRGGSVRWESPRLVEEMRAIGWGVLADAPGFYVARAVTQPWKGEVQFRALPPDEFAAFDEPGYAKIVWTLEAEDLPGGEATVRTRTRVKTTDPSARRRFCAIGRRSRRAFSSSATRCCGARLNAGCPIVRCRKAQTGSLAHRLGSPMAVVIPPWR